MCNEKVKFGNLWGKAKAIGADYIATGHYAIAEHGPDRTILRRGRDGRKDQSYFLFSLKQAQLRHILLPLGGMEKPAIRAIARQLGLKTADKQDSQEICFVPGNDYKAFLRSHLGENDFHPGRLRDLAGQDLGPHEGIELFTIGQRKGLPGGSDSPRYVVDIDPATATVIVGEASDLICDEFTITHCSWHHFGAGAAPESFPATVKIRYSAPGAAATVYPGENGEARVRLEVPQRAITPGQAAVCYRGDEVLGGGWIARQQAFVRPRAQALAAALPEPSADEEFVALEGGCGAKR
jgi:tRNA-specific 2-thiouridylase